MKRILVTYATMAGSTQDVARIVGEEIAKTGVQVDILPLEQIADIEVYDAVVIGAPMIMGWHRSASSFIKKHRRAFQHIPLAIFVMAMSLTQTGETSIDGVPVDLDGNLAKPIAIEGRPNFRERYARPSNYLRPILGAARPVRPVSIGVFGGRLEYGRLKWWAVLFAMVIIRARAGDRRNWPAIRAWAGRLAADFSSAAR